MPTIFYWIYGKGPTVFLLHGGPGVPGYVAPLGREVSGKFCVIEPFQRESGQVPLTVEQHVEDLHQLITELCPEHPPAIIGHSWGAMLALAYAAAYPDTVNSLALVGCGTFDIKARARMKEICDERMSEDLRQRLESLSQDYPDADARIKAMGDLLTPLYAFDHIDEEDTTEKIDGKGHEETWNDMLRLQEEGIYPSAFEVIKAPVIMLHGAYDPHPGKMIRDSLKPFIPQLEYREWEECGHYPWLERAIWDEFIATLKKWLSLQFTEGY